MDCFLACQFFFVVVAFVSLVLLVIMDGAESTAPSPPLVVDLNQLLQVNHAQVRASAQRDEQLKALLETFSSGQPPVPVVSPAPTPHIPAAKPIAVDRPTLLSSATLADFTAWSEAWDDYARCQLLSTQPLLTRMSAFRQTLDEDLRRFIREGIISIPDTSDVQEAKDELRKFIRRQRNPLLDRMEFYRRAQQPGESFDAWYTSLRELFHACNFTGLSVCSTCSGRMCAACTQGLSALGDDILRDRIVTGVLSDEARHKLLATKDLTLKACVDLCRAEEAANQTGSCLPSAGQALNGSSVNAAAVTLSSRPTRSASKLEGALRLPQPKAAADRAAKAPHLTPARRSAQTVVVRHTPRTHAQQRIASVLLATGPVIFCPCVLLLARRRSVC